MPAGQVTSRDKVLKAREMLDDGVSRTQVQHTLGLAWSTVESIYKGRHGALHHDVFKSTRCRFCGRKMFNLRKDSSNCKACKAEKQAAITLASQRAMNRT